MSESLGYTLAFCVAVCLVCAVFVSSSAVGLKDRQEANKILDRQKKVLVVAGLLEDGAPVTREEVEDLFNILKTPRKACAYVNVDGKDFIAWCESEIDEPEMMKAIIFKYCEINLDKRCRSVEVIELVITGRPMFEMA